MKSFNWSNDKNLWLQDIRKVCFEDAVREITEHRVLDNFKHPNQKTYPNQKIFIIAINGYACRVPYIESEETIFFKTIIPSRQATKKYLVNKP
ncbi:MAG: toxin [Candidatus Doudnabacteria bacterium]|nr:toxin [Candidatus Doudnabacteria bacterium]